MYQSAWFGIQYGRFDTGFELPMPFSIRERKRIWKYGYAAGTAQTGVYKIQSVENPLYDRKESHLILRADHKTYQPGTSPFTVIVEEIDPTLEIHFPHITGKMEGTLYNTENPRDSITFQKVEFRIW